MRYLILLLILYSFNALEAKAAGNCYELPDFISYGNKDMDSVSEAESILCDSNIHKHSHWDGKFNLKGHINYIKDKIISSKDINKAIASGVNFEFQNCIFPDEINIQDKIDGRLKFTKCIFRSNFNISAKHIESSLNISQSVFFHGLKINRSSFEQPLVIEDSVIAGDVEIDETNFKGGVKLENVRLNGNWVTRGFQSPADLSVIGTRFLKSWSMIDSVITGSVYFKNTDWTEGSLIKFENGNITGSIGFYKCSFNNVLNVGKSEIKKSLLRFSNISIGYSVVLNDANGRVKVLNTTKSIDSDDSKLDKIYAIENNFPLLKVDRTLIPLLRLPNWSIAKIMIGINSDEFEMREKWELLLLAYKGYTGVGNLRDAVMVHEEIRLVEARNNSYIAYLFQKASYFFISSILYLVLLVFLIFAIFSYNGKQWGLVNQNDGKLLHIYKCLDLSINAFFKGPPRDSSMINVSNIAKVIMMFERIIGVMLLFSLSVWLKEWFIG